jgi:hypothetical protein
VSRRWQWLATNIEAVAIAVALVALAIAYALANFMEAAPK